jgi:hypothetical protein
MIVIVNGSADKKVNFLFSYHIKTYSSICIMLEKVGEDNIDKQKSQSAMYVYSQGDQLLTLT